MAEGPSLDAGLTALFAATFAALAWRDLRTRTLPNSLVYPAIVLALAAPSGWGARGPAEAPVGCGMAFLGAATVRAFGHGGLGGGDVKMAALVGAVVGYPAMLNAAAIAVVGGGAVAALLLSVGRIQPTATLPYGPCMALGALIVLVR